MCSVMPQRLSGCTYMTYAVRYATQLYPSPQLGGVSYSFIPNLVIPIAGWWKTWHGTSRLQYMQQRSLAGCTSSYGYVVCQHAD